MDVAAGRLREWLADAAGCGEPVRRQGSGCWGACINVSDIAPGESTCGVGCEVHDGAFRDQDILIDTNGLHVLERPSASAKSSGYARILERAREASALAQSDALSGAPTHDAMDAVDLAARKRFMRSTLSEPVWQPADCALRGHSTRQKRRILGLSGLGIHKRLSPVSTAQQAVNEGPLSSSMSFLSLGEAALPQPTLPAHSLLQKRTNEAAAGASAPLRVKFADLKKLKIVGKGSTAAVWLCEDSASHEKFAMKQLPLSNNDGKRDLVLRELVTMYGLNTHASIVTCHAVFYSNNAFHIVMELMDGGSLLDALKRCFARDGTHAMPPSALAAVAVDMLRALTFLHDGLQVIHRDIKPGNILLSSSGQAKLGDFGIATQPGEVVVDAVGGGLAESLGRPPRLLRTGSNPAEEWIGTMTYMSPERLAGDSYTCGADVWALGLVLVECGIGYYPFAAAGDGDKGSLEFWDFLELVTNGPCPSSLLSGRGCLNGESWTALQALAAASLSKDVTLRPCAHDLWQMCCSGGGDRDAGAVAVVDLAQADELAAWVRMSLDMETAVETVNKGQPRECNRVGSLACERQGLVDHEGSEADGWL